MQDELPSSSHFFIEYCHWRIGPQYTVTAKDGIPSNLRPWMASYFSTLDGAEIGLAEAEAYYDEQTMLAAHYSRLSESSKSKGA